MTIADEVNFGFVEQVNRVIVLHGTNRESLKEALVQDPHTASNRRELGYLTQDHWSAKFRGVPACRLMSGALPIRLARMPR